MLLAYCKFDGLIGFPSLELNDLRELTALIGPNGAGKSSILKVLRLAFEIISKNTLCDTLPSHDPWNRFSRAVLIFSSSKPIDFGPFSTQLGEGHHMVSIEIQCDDSAFRIDSINAATQTLKFPSPQSTRTAIANTEASLQETSESVRSIEKQLQQLPAQAANRLAMVNQLEATKNSVPARKEQLARENVVNAVSTSTGEHTLTRGDVDALLLRLGLPSFEYVDAHQFLEDGVTKFIDQLMRQKKGRKSEFNKYDQAVKRMNHLLQADIDLSEHDGIQSLHINGAPYVQASTGTKASLGFFGLTRLIDQNCIVVWDEPENGLHPTRRTRILELMFNDGRQYVIATHASEFAPVFSPKGRVFRCIANYDEEASNVRLVASPVATRREAFSALEALGVHPARTLFTANVVLWVEGPTELLFYRRWLTQRLSRVGLKEGFHYSFMQYGGALVSYMSAADDAHFLSAFDTLSMCRHPIFIVDSDLRSVPAEGTAPYDYLKPGASRLLRQVEALNSDRPDAAIFAWTGGREVENYLPEAAVAHAIKAVWKGFEKYSDRVPLEDLKIGQYDAYHEGISDLLISAGVVDVDASGSDRPSAKGRSTWGPGNKVEFMEAALSMPELAEKDLRWNCVDVLERIERFIVNKSEHDPAD